MKNEIEKRMKEFYENRFRFFLPRKTYVIIRIDGKNFKTYTKKLQKPFDKGLTEDMIETTKYLCEKIQGAKLGYTQSDEISILLTDLDSPKTDMWFDGNIQKIVSISASIASVKFNELRLKRHFKNIKNDYLNNIPKLANFDSRVFIIPSIHEVVNYFIWRQMDATRNSISMAGHAKFSPNQVKFKNTSEIQDMLMKEKNINWNDYSISEKRGTIIKKVEKIYAQDKNNLKNMFEIKSYDNLDNKEDFNVFMRNKWEVVDTPIITKNKEVILDTL